MISGLNDLKNLSDSLKKQTKLMPVLFVGHGSPMNGIEDNEFSRNWSSMAKEIPQPEAVLVISAHWYTDSTKVTAMEKPKTIHDFYGFPKELFAVNYPAPGSPELAMETKSLISHTQVELDHDWGLDHGTWTVVRYMYPDAKIPVLQLSIDYRQHPSWHYELGKELLALRKKGVLIIGSGNMVHNLRMVSWDMINGGGYDWAYQMNDTFKKLIDNKEHQKLIRYDELGSGAMLAIPTPEHYLPLLYTLSLQQSNEGVSFFNDKLVGGSLNMTSLKISQ
ncbi:4,5-DOPA dioxygenase extradiol [Sphingobacterium spiritivorum]|uniref:4,5-DOPA-extradiol-dioxygenase n=1 Tax=Sphingobacterium TaxID=28453 RepID=UPI00191AE8AC|nr:MULTISPECIES: 4,5-DOPA dioxygenase extradiol [Sphingobacterium]QQT24995.1 4,5-DOPA dioxygenase extradiol [Sphingobacterium spiritivorum]